MGISLSAFDIYIRMINVSLSADEGLRGHVSVQVKSGKWVICGQAACLLALLLQICFCLLSKSSSTSPQVFIILSLFLHKQTYHPHAHSIFFSFFFFKCHIEDLASYVIDGVFAISSLQMNASFVDMVKWEHWLADICREP